MEICKIYFISTFVFFSGFQTDRILNTDITFFLFVVKIYDKYSLNDGF